MNWIHEFERQVIRKDCEDINFLWDMNLIVSFLSSLLSSYDCFDLVAGILQLFQTCYND